MARTRIEVEGQTPKATPRRSTDSLPKPAKPAGTARIIGNTAPGRPKGKR